MDLRYNPNLVLYLPLYELDGASFMSRDKHGHLATVTGALWTPWGRDFDGVDDKIVSANIGIGAGTPATIIMWLYITDKASDRGVSNGILGDLALYQHPANDNFYTSTPTDQRWSYAVPEAQWLFTSITWTDNWNQMDLQFNLESKTMVSPYNAASPAVATIELAKQAANFGKIKVGELSIYNRVLSALEIQRHYLATKWRYQ